MPLASGISITCDTRDPDAVRRILGDLPDRFGIEEAVRGYVETASRLRTYLAVLEDRVVGVLLLEWHFASSAEIHLIAVDPRVHRQGIGSLLVTRAEQDLRAADTHYLQVKTLGGSHPSTHYAKTRQFYLQSGFSPLEELNNLWPGNPCLIMVKAL